MESQRAIDIFVAFSDFKIQTAFGSPLATNLINVRHPQTDPVFPDRQRTRRTIFHCNGQDVIREKISEEFYRWTFAFPATAELVAGWLALANGAAAAPTGTAQDEIQTATGAGVTDGSFTATFNFEGVTATTPALAWDISAADFKAALEALGSIGSGQVATVTGTLVTGFIVTFAGKLALADLTALSFDSSNLTGGSIAVVETQKGANKYHAITRSPSYDLVKTSFIVGFEQDSTAPNKYQDFAVDAVTLDAPNRGDLSCTVELIGGTEKVPVAAFDVPECVNQDAIAIEDCRFRVDGDYVSDKLFSLRYEKRNNIPTGTDAFLWNSRKIGIIQRGDQPTESFAIGYYGSEGDNLYAKADAEEKLPLILDLGVPGERVSINAPETLLKLASPAYSFDGDLRRSVVNIEGTPHFATSLNAPSKVDAYLARTAAFLTS